MVSATLWSGGLKRCSQMCLGFSIGFRYVQHHWQAPIKSKVNSLFLLSPPLHTTHMLAGANFGSALNQRKGYAGASKPCELLYGLSSSDLHPLWCKDGSEGMLLCSYNLLVSRTNNKACTCLCHVVLTQQKVMRKEVVPNQRCDHFDFLSVHGPPGYPYTGHNK